MLAQISLNSAFIVTQASDDLRGTAAQLKSPSSSPNQLCMDKKAVADALDAMTDFHGHQSCIHAYLENLSLIARGAWALIEVCSVAILVLVFILARNDPQGKTQDNWAGKMFDFVTATSVVVPFLALHWSLPVFGSKNMSVKAAVEVCQDSFAFQCYSRRNC
jgi:hypothetical protein